MWLVSVVALNLAFSPSAGSEGLVAFTRGGNIHVLDLATREVTAITTDGSGDYWGGSPPLQYGCASFVSGNELIYLAERRRDEGRNFVQSFAAFRAGVDGAGARRIRGISNPRGLGYCHETGRVMFMRPARDPRGGSEGDDEGLIGLFYLEPSGEVADSGVRNRAVEFYTSDARIRCSRSRDLVALPSFPSDLSTLYDLQRLSDSEWVPHVAALASEGAEWQPSLYMNVFGSGLDFGRECVYGTLYAYADSEGGHDEGPTLPSGLYRLDLETYRHQMVAKIPRAWNVAVSEPLGIAVVGSRVLPNDEGTALEAILWLVDLATGRTERLCDGYDPDVWPR